MRATRTIADDERECDGKAGGVPSCEDLIERHRSLAEHIARKFSRRREEVDELTQVAMIGLWHAARRFDPGRGVSFPTFAWRTISGELKRHRRDRGWMIRPARGAHDKFLAVSGWIEQVTHELGRSPTIREVAERSGLTEEDVVVGIEVLERGNTDSLEKGDPLGEESPASLAVVDAGYDAASDRAELADLLVVLTPTERTVVALRFYGDLTQSEIGARLGCSQMHVSRVLSTALAKLRTAAAGPPGARPHGAEAGSGRRTQPARPDNARLRRQRDSGAAQRRASAFVAR